MKLKNKKTGEIIELLAKLSFVKRDKENYLASKVVCFDSLAELNEEWEDYEEPKEYHYITNFSSHPFSKCDIGKFPLDDEYRKEIGNYFDTREEAEKAVEKLKAWKRLKDNGFEFKRCEIIDGRIDFMILPKGEYREQVYDDLDLLFGGEE